MVTDNRRAESLVLLNATHEFPCRFLFKVIGLSENSFVARVVAIVRESLNLEEDPPFQTRETPNGKHVSVTLEPHLDSAELVLAVYDRLRFIEGVVIVL